MFACEKDFEHIDTDDEQRDSFGLHSAHAVLTAHIILPLEMTDWVLSVLLNAWPRIK